MIVYTTPWSNGSLNLNSRNFELLLPLRAEVWFYQCHIWGGRKDQVYFGLLHSYHADVKNR